MENKTTQNDWFAELHTQHLQEAVTIVHKSVSGVITEEDLERNPTLIEEGVTPGDLIEIHSTPESAEQLVITPKPAKVPAKRGRKKKVK